MRVKDKYMEEKGYVDNYIEFACREGVLDPQEAMSWTEEEKLAYYRRGQLADLYSEPY